MRWVFLVLALGLLAMAWLTVVGAWNTGVWKLAVVAGEYGHYLGLAGLVLFCAIGAQAVVIGGDGGKGYGWVMVMAAVATLGAMWLLFAPAVLGAMVGQRLPVKMAEGLGAKVPAGRVVDWGRMLMPWPGPEAVAMSTHVFVHAGTQEALRLDFYHPTKGTLSGGARPPCVIMVHGGGWESSDRGQLAEFNHWLAGQGYGVAAISYRLAPQYPWPAQREDTLAAISWIKAHAEQLGIDGGRLVLMGRSVGAQIASAVGYGVPDSAIRGVVGLYGVYDMEFVWSISRENDVLNSVRLMNQYLGGGPTVRNQQEYDSASAQGLVVTGRTPPTLLMHGTIDTLCWVKHSQRLAARLEEAKVPHVMVELPWAVHEFDYNLQGPGGQLTTYAVEQFLKVVCDPWRAIRKGDMEM